MFDPGLVRHICQELADEDHPDRVSELVSLLQAVIQDDQDEVRLRVQFLVRKYEPALRGVAPLERLEPQRTNGSTDPPDPDQRPSLPNELRT
jgi:hypothetical protein